ncbi:hypothetical protein [Streptomyces qinzhouensis]|uniref:Transcriptional regulator n=1 Tax=Streptomyces qinzhouensis TaxID=2599401 RepID=A0A5B8IKI7_9ACTN|nr:hypothetical protein [Streptomyces qinzhouensis]QDY79002.1 hypothetical protein FQU76_23570 [Streptomyces qinzhouensis]
MATTVGVIGPEDLVHKVLVAGTECGVRRLRPYAVRREDDTERTVARARAESDALLFTGIVPYSVAAAAGLLDRPAMYVPYSGATLLRTLVELLRLGHDVSRISIDTLGRAEVVETLTEAMLPTEHVQVLPYRPGLTSHDLADFHRDARDRKGARVAVTCAGSAYRLLEHELHTVRLLPSRHSVRATLRALLLATAGVHSEDARVALGIVEVSPGPDGAGAPPATAGTDRTAAGSGGTNGTAPGAPARTLAEELRILGGSLAELPDGRPLVVTTKGVLAEVTGNFTRLPFLDVLAARHGAVRIGFGLGRTAAEAEALAARAVARARAVGPVAAVICPKDDVDIVIGPEDTPPPGTREESGTAAALARRTGLNRKTLDSLRALAAEGPGEGLTAHLVAEHLDVQQRTARRILKRLERAGVAVPAALRQEGQTGRPPIVYRVRL